MKASESISKMIGNLPDWQRKAMNELREQINSASSDLVEEWKWNTAVWTAGGNVVAVGAFKDHIKINFFNGASLDDPKSLFNAGLDAKTSRAIDVHEGERVNTAAFKALVRAAVESNRPKAKARR
jgi:hypothetical protein